MISHIEDVESKIQEHLTQVSDLNLGDKVYTY
jgi:hypothetical protein